MIAATIAPTVTNHPPLLHYAAVAQQVALPHMAGSQYAVLCHHCHHHLMYEQSAHSHHYDRC